MKPCSSCKQGEVVDEDTDGKIYTVRDPDTGRIILRGYLCSDHIAMYLDDGYQLEGGS